MSVNKKTLTLAFVCSGKVFLTNPSHAPGGSRPSGCPLCTVWKPPSGKPGKREDYSLWTDVLLHVADLYILMWV